MTDRQASLSVLQQLEEGRIDVDEALRQLDANAEARAEPQAEAPRTPAGAPRRSHLWWLIPLAIGTTFLGTGGWLASIGGAWWLLVVPLLVLGTVMTILAAISSQSPWILVTVRSASGPRARIWIPIPLRLAAWGVQIARPWVASRVTTSVDEVLATLEAELGADRDLVIEVDDTDDDERVQVTFDPGRGTWHLRKSA